MEKRYNKELKAFGQQVKNLRQKKALSQLDIEVSSGINRSDISKIENGLINIEFATIVKLAIALEVDLNELFEK